MNWNKALINCMRGKYKIGIGGLFIFLLAFADSLNAQVAAVEFGKNRIQYRKYNWRFYQGKDFNVYFNQGGLELAKYVLQIAEEELPELEKFTEVGMQIRSNIILYNSWEDMQASNVGLGNELNDDVGGFTQLVNNKMLVYFNGNHADLRIKIREGIARILVDNKLFGENLGEIAGNATLLDLPKWLTDGYVAYAAQNWSVPLDDKLKNSLLALEYKNFYDFANKEPLLAGHAFWNFLANNYKKDNVSYFLYLAILYKNVNQASQRVCKKKFKDVLSEFMEKEVERYEQDIRKRRNYPKGTNTLVEDVDNNKDYFHFTPNPNRRSYTYAVTEYKKGRYKVQLFKNYVSKKILIKNGVRVAKHERSPNYPIMSWDGKGTKLSIVYWESDKVRLKVYDMNTDGYTYNQELPFDQVQDAQYYLDQNRLILSAVKNGHTDIFIYYIKEQKVEQITDDVWDDLDASFVSFPNKYGILFASNRPSADAATSDTTLPGKNTYNIFMVDVEKKGGFRQITQLTNMSRGDARYPTQYNMNHFTFVGAENGVANRYAGFFTTKAAGLDTLYMIGDEILRNPDYKEIDSTLKAWNRTEPDSIGIIAITKDSTYAFPLTNYASSLLESRIAGDNGQVSEVIQQSGMKMLYRLRVDSMNLIRRNVNARPTNYIKGIMDKEKEALGNAKYYQNTKQPASEVPKPANNNFVSEFDNETKDSGSIFNPYAVEKKSDRVSALESAKLYKYKLKFSNDMVMAGVTNNMILNRYQPYAGGAGPINLNNDNNLSFALLASLSDVMEDYRITGGVKPGTNFKDNEYFVNFQNRRRRVDWGAGFYRSSRSIQYSNGYPGKILTTIYQANASYPFDVVRSLRLSAAARLDKFLVNAVDDATLHVEDQMAKYGNLRLEYVHDNAVKKAQNIYNGLRYKVYGEVISSLGKPAPGEKRQFTYVMGADARYYYPIYRNFIWAVRGAMDLSWGQDKMMYYLGGIDSWISPKFNRFPLPDNTQNYIYQTLAVNMRGYKQNLANGNNAAVINSEFRLPVFTTLLNKPINNAFLRNFQLTQFIDFGTAWNGIVKNIQRPEQIFTTNDQNNPVTIKMRAGGVGPFAGGYGFGARSVLFGYLLKFDAGWPMSGFFQQKPVLYFSLGLDF
ncbi:hypothetical protein [Polluticaenibacter yanchengensis]|uniref:Uncharacterized protein n=1 Tax=Polluticaenibacter yanchengensis TaxID=3014562 RepID=A0ABT4ULG0_9BACT|nr:hypothetical protein [Chitinophagaceae bacterium LY-5]